MIRAASAGDAAVAGGLVVRAWRWALTETAEPQSLAALSPEEHAAVLATVIADPGADVLVEEVGGRVAALAVIGDCREADVPPGVGALGLLAVDPPAQGAGVGTALHAAALDAVVRRGAQAVVVRVPVVHAHGRRFLERLGWHPDAGARETPEPLLGDLPTIRYRRDVP